MRCHNVHTHAWYSEHDDDNKRDDIFAETLEEGDCEVVVAEPCHVESITETVYDVAVLNTIDDDGEACTLSVPSAVATPLNSSHFQSSIIGSRPANTSSNDTAQLRPTDQRTQQANGIRPEFIFASALLHGTTTIDKIGILFDSRTKGGVLVAGFTVESPFLGSNIQPGDHVIAINHWLCADYSVDRVRALMQASNNQISLCVHNPRGDPQLVSSSIMKPNPNAKVGITLRRRFDVIRIKEMAEDSLLMDTLMTPQQRCRSINGVSCNQLKARTASALIGLANSRVTIITELQESCAVTIGTQEPACGGWWYRITSSIGWMAGNINAVRMDATSLES